MEYSVYNERGTILRSGSMPSSLFLETERTLSPGQKIINKKGNDFLQKVVNGKLVNYTEEEIEDRQYNFRKDTLPNLSMVDGSLSDKLLDEMLHSYYCGRVDIAKWKVDHYSLLRGWAYPPQVDYLDAVVKLSSDSSDEVIRGKVQKREYINACLAVKERFPKD